MVAVIQQIPSGEFNLPIEDVNCVSYRLDNLIFSISARW